MFKSAYQCGKDNQPYHSRIRLNSILASVIRGELKRGDSNMKSIYQRVKELALPVITEYKDDLLVHDRNEIKAFKKCDFIHMTRPSGTHMIIFRPSESYPVKGERIRYLFGTADRIHILNDTCGAVPYLLKEQNIELILYRKGDSITEITASEACDLVEEYRQAMLELWSK